MLLKYYVIQTDLLSEKVADLPLSRFLYEEDVMARSVSTKSGTAFLRLGTTSAVGLMLTSAAGVAASLPLPSANTLDFNGPALSVQNTHTQASASDPLPSALRGFATGSSGVGVVGGATGANGAAIRGLYNGTVVKGLGYGGAFYLSSPNPASASAAITGVHFGGLTTANGPYGSAAIFQSNNAHNTSPAVAITSAGTGNYALRVISSGASPLVTTGAGYFEINSPQAQFGQSSVLAVHSGGSKNSGSNGRYGTAGFFQITNTNNFDSALVGKTSSVQGTGVEGDDFSTGGGVAVFGNSTAGMSAMFSGGSGGSGTCSYDGSAGFNCPSDRNLKDHFSEADLDDVLDKLGKLPMFYYQMKKSRVPARYLGPTAQDFKAAFDLGKNDTTINTANAQGVALAAAKGLYEKVKADEAKIAEQNAKISALKAQVAALQDANARTVSLERQVERQAALLSGLAQEVASLSRRNAIRQANITP